MKLEVIYGPAQWAELTGRDLREATAVVIDVLRATSSIVTALANGAQAVRPVATVEEARALREELAAAHGADAVLLAGERGGIPLEGFDLGNSPEAFTPKRVAGRRIVHTTSNGTPALAACAGCRDVVAGAFLNLTAVSDFLTRHAGHILLVCAGTGPRFALEDALFAAAVADRLQPRHPLAALWRSCAEEPLETALARSRNGRALQRLGLAADTAFAAQVDRYHVLPKRTPDGWLKL